MLRHIALGCLFLLGRKHVLSADELNSQNWIVEQMPGGTVVFHDGEMEIRDVGGCTVWLREKLIAPVEIHYEAMVVDEGKPGDRVSDLNCFWMATDPRSPNHFFSTEFHRTGKFEDYDALQTYYVGYGGNNNTTTHFRRYAGDSTNPLLPEHDLRSPDVLLQPNRWYRTTLFDYADPKFLESGYIGIRTVASHLRIRRITISSARTVP